MIPFAPGAWLGNLAMAVGQGAVQQQQQAFPGGAGYGSLTRAMLAPNSGVNLGSFPQPSMMPFPYMRPTGASAASAAATNQGLFDMNASLGTEYLKQQGQNQRLQSIAPLFLALMGGGGGPSGFTSSFGQGVDAGSGGGNPLAALMGAGQQGPPKGMNPQKFANDAWKADKEAKAKAEGYW